MSRLVGLDVELKPQRPGADRRCLSRDLGCVGGGPENVDDIDLLGHVEQRAIDALAKEHVREWVDRDDAKAPALEAFRNRAARLDRIAGGADHGDRRRALENRLG